MSGAVSVCFACGRCNHTWNVVIMDQKFDLPLTAHVPCGWLVRFSRSGDQFDVLCPSCQTPSQREWLRQQTHGRSAVDAEVISVDEDEQKALG